MDALQCLKTSVQKQFFIDCLQSRCSEKFRKLHKKTHVLESLSQTQVFSSEINKIFKNILFYRTPLVELLLSLKSNFWGIRDKHR